jgi:hypothetical protein
MKTRRTVTEAKLRSLVKEALDGTQGGSVYTAAPEVVQLSAVVDPLEDSTVPCNPSFTPHDKTEFGVAVNNLVRNLPDDEMPDLYRMLKAGVKGSEEAKVESKKVLEAEQAIRREVRRVLRSEGFADASGKGIDYFGGADDNIPDPEEKPVAKRRKMSTMQDVGGATFEQIAAETGLSVAGAKQAVDKAMRRAQFLAQDLDYDERELIVLTAIRDYLKKLETTGEVTAADIRLMSDHPDIIRELDGFREFLHRYIRRAEKQHRASQSQED